MFHFHYYTECTYTESLIILLGSTFSLRNANLCKVSFLLSVNMLSAVILVSRDLNVTLGVMASFQFQYYRISILLPA
jgi:hypothetical protein